jgi:bifunctional non-homologous end joining protein LigD
MLQGSVMAHKTDKLKQYRTRRDLTQSPEPRGAPPKASKKPIFVVQKHAASHLHYDVRLEIDGVLVSWAVPKGPPQSTRVKRLAIRTDDHPREYAKFEGVIPAGNYGAGTVMVWDKGTYQNIKHRNGKTVPMKECLNMGTVEVALRGKKLNGNYALIKTARGWLLIRMRHQSKPAKKAMVEKNRSALTGRTMAQIRKDEQ